MICPFFCFLPLVSLDFSLLALDSKHIGGISFDSLSDFEKMRSVPCSLGRYSGFDIFFPILIWFLWVSWILASDHVGSVCGQKKRWSGCRFGGVVWFYSFFTIGFETCPYLHFPVYWSRFVGLISNRRFSS